MVMQLDRVRRHAKTEKVKEGGKAVFAATERDDEAPVGAEVGEGGPNDHAASRISSSGWAETSSPRSEEHTSELQSLMRISYAVFCLKKKTHKMVNITTEKHSKSKVTQNSETCE